MYIYMQTYLRMWIAYTRMHLYIFIQREHDNDDWIIVLTEPSSPVHRNSLAYSSRSERPSLMSCQVSIWISIIFVVCYHILIHYLQYFISCSDSLPFIHFKSIHMNSNKWISEVSCWLNLSFSGMYGDLNTLGAGNAILIILQLFAAGMVVIILDELLQKGTMIG